ncbi:MAG: hypothetical protein ABSA06_00490 [Geobacteraceae bacterium]|jgi:hypothetical protein
MTTHPNLCSFFTYSVNDYILPDLKRLREEIRPNQDEKGLQGCTVPTAMFAFSILDLVGFLMRPDNTAKRDETTKNISYMLSVTAGLFPAEYEPSSEVLIKLFRHGLMHQVFPKACGIAKTPPSLNLPLIFYQSNTPNLNVDRLVDDLVKALLSLDAKVRTDGVLATRMEGRLLDLYREDQNQLQKMKTKGLVAP